MFTSIKISASSSGTEIKKTKRINFFYQTFFNEQLIFFSKIRILLANKHRKTFKYYFYIVKINIISSYIQENTLEKYYETYLRFRAVSGSSKTNVVEAKASESPAIVFPKPKNKIVET